MMMRTTHTIGKFDFQQEQTENALSVYSVISCSIPGILMLLLSLAIAAGAHAADAPRRFPAPEAAVSALSDALKSTNIVALRAMFGAAWDDLMNPDPVQSANDLTALASALHQSNRLHRVSESRVELEVGADRWPFPIPLVQGPGGWFFDAAAGLDEILNRRVGGNELAVLATVRACVQAQRDYASRDRDGDEVLEFAQRLISSPGAKDGLYWSRKIDGEISPLGPLVARAQAVGYKRSPSGTNAVPQPFHGYYFKLITRQGKHAPGGKYDYVVNGNMIGGFALVAWPAEHGESGIMTFIINQQGRVYQKDLGSKTGFPAADLKAYDPDNSWAVSAD